jgi:hypothetical protein
VISVQVLLSNQHPLCIFCLSFVLHVDLTGLTDLQGVGLSISVGSFSAVQEISYS